MFGAMFDVGSETFVVCILLQLPDAALGPLAGLIPLLFGAHVLVVRWVQKYETDDSLICLLRVPVNVWFAREWNTSGQLSGMPELSQPQGQRHPKGAGPIKSSSPSFQCHLLSDQILSDQRVFALGINLSRHVSRAPCDACPGASGTEMSAR